MSGGTGPAFKDDQGPLKEGPPAGLNEQQEDKNQLSPGFSYPL